MIAHLRKLTPLALVVLLLLMVIVLDSSRIKLLFSGEVPSWRIAAMAGILILLSYFGAESMRRRLIRDAKKERDDARKARR